MKNQELLKIVQEYSYAGIFLWFAFIQIIFPIPQEIALISVGYFSTHIHIYLIFSILISTAGIMTSDMIIFYLSRSGSKITQKIMARFNKSWLSETKGKLDKNSINTLFILLMIPEARTIAPLLAGATNIPIKKFISINFLANLFLCTVYSLLGRFFYSSLKELGSKIDGYKHLIFIGIMLVGAILIGLFLKKKYLKK
jgi:membrane-associated protein